MRRPGYDGGFWPDELQQLVLQAAVLEPSAAARAWRALRGQLVLDDLEDPEVHRLLPMVQQNLTAAGVDDPDLERMKGLYRRTWYENQLRIHTMVPVLEQLQNAGVPTLLLKGIPLALEYYGQLGLRPMADVDVLIPFDALDRTLDLLEADGWSDPGLDVSRERRRDSYHGAAMLHPDGRSLDVHWQLGLPFVFPHAPGASNDDFWAAAVPITVAGFPTQTLSPADLLLHVIVHGTWSGSSATVRWAADSAVLIRTAGTRLDWSRLLDQTVRRRLVLPVRNGLRYVADELDAPVPADVHAGLARAPVARQERHSYLISAADTSRGRPVIGGLLDTRAYWARQSAKWSPRRAARELPAFLQDNWNLEHPAQVPAEAVRKAAVRLRRLRASAKRRSL